MNFSSFDKTELEILKQEAKRKWGHTQVYQEFDKKGDIMFDLANQEMMAIFKELHDLKNLAVSDKAVQDEVKDLQDIISYNFYPCNKTILSNLGLMYKEDNRFSDTIDSYAGQGTADFTSEAIAYYCQSES